MGIAASRGATRVFRYAAPGGLLSARVVVEREEVSGRFSHPALRSRGVAQYRLSASEVRSLTGGEPSSMLSFGVRHLNRAGAPEWVDLKAGAAKSGKTVPAYIASELHDDFPIRILTPGRSLRTMQDCWVMVFADPRCASFEANAPIEDVEGPLMSARLLERLAALSSKHEIPIP